jgi:hypothetical protein
VDEIPIKKVLDNVDMTNGEVEVSFLVPANLRTVEVIVTSELLKVGDKEP